jgi:hypothetical protein
MTSYPLLSGQGVLDLSRPCDEDLDEVRTAGWKPDEDATGSRPIRRIDVKRDCSGQGSVSGYIVGDGMSQCSKYQEIALSKKCLQLRQAWC